MNLFDLGFVLAVLAAALVGYRLGLAVRLLSWAGLLVGLVAGIALLPLIVDAVKRADYPLVVLVALAIVFVPAALGETIGAALGRGIQPRAPRRAAADRVLGGVAGVVGVAALVWLVLPVMSASAGWPADLVDGSSIAQAFEDHLPEPPGIEDALRALIGEDRYPEVFATLQPPVLVRPPAATGIDDATAARVATSVVRVRAEACDVVQLGTGFTVAPSLIATNAHVVAGERSTTVDRDDGRRLRATLVAFDPRRDVALLAVPGLDRAPLSLGSAERADSGGVFGHPEGGPLRIAPYTVARVSSATGSDIYGVATVTREVLTLAADLQRGDSGSALVDPAGTVDGMAFAVAPDEPGVAYALAPSEVTAVLTAPHDTPVDAGPCIG